MEPFVSICIPTYNLASNLKILLNSIAEQNFKDFNVIISDDSPGDEIQTIANSEEWNFPISYYKNQPAKGSPGNWNNAISKANGKWIKLVHHDDWFDNPNTLQHFVNATFENPDGKFFYCKTLIFDASTNLKFNYNPPKKRLDQLMSHPAILFHTNVIGGPSTTLIHRDIANEFRYNIDLIWLVDIEYYIRIMQNHKIYLVNESLIITTSGSLHQLTNSLINDKYINLREYLYCYNLFKKLLNKANLAIFIERILFVLQQFEVKSTIEISDAGYKGIIPLFVKLYCHLASINPKLAQKVLGKWIQTQLIKHDSYRTS